MNLKMDLMKSFRVLLTSRFLSLGEQEKRQESFARSFDFSFPSFVLVFCKFFFFFLSGLAASAGPSVGVGRLHLQRHLSAVALQGNGNDVGCARDGNTLTSFAYSRPRLPQPMCRLNKVPRIPTEPPSPLTPPSPPMSHCLAERALPIQ